MTDASYAITPPPLVVVMGIAGVGKSSVGHELADRLGLEYADGDAFQSQSNIDKMSAGIALTDEDRWPWLRSIGTWLGEHDADGAVISCSALRRTYRAVLVEAAPRVAFLHLYGDLDLIRRRMHNRPDHFMPASLLSSQQATLEALALDENGVALDIADSPASIVDAFLAGQRRQA